ncbi:MAG: endopeptidase La [Malacoplasma sp.]|nr:endopeptidase La [Malacoplasma sp.]
MNNNKKSEKINQNNDQKLFANVLITRGIIVFPTTSLKIEIGRDKSIAAIDDSQSKNEHMIVVSQKNPSIDSPNKDDIFLVGTLCSFEIKQVYEDGSYSIVYKGIKRVKILNLFEKAADSKSDKKFYCAEYEVIEENKKLSKKNEDNLKDLYPMYEKNLKEFANIPAKDYFLSKENRANIVEWLPLVLKFQLEIKQDLLEEANLAKRIERIIALSIDDEESKKIDASISKKINSNISKQQKEFYLRERVRAIKEELGDISSREDDSESIRDKVRNNPYPEHIKKRILSELNKLEASSNSNEYSMSKAYIDWLVDLPYWQETEDVKSLKEVEDILNKNHYGLEKVKERIVEYLAVRMKSKNAKGSIICLVGPPGVGKTSLAQSIAEALKKKFVKISLGGMRDEAELKGHRKTYIGSMPGRIIKSMQKAGVINPLFLLDEIDKLGYDHKGDPASALLDILDPEQNNRFSDNYIEEDYDLSQVLFLTTANYEENIPEPLHDRLEIIRLSSYTENEKLSIAKNYLVKKILNESSLKKEELKFTDEGLNYVIKRYTREAGVREVERAIRQIARKFVVRQQKENIKSQVIGVDEVKFYLKKEIYDYTKKDKEYMPGVVNGMAYTTAGGDLLPIEATFSPGKGKIEITGNLKETMKESVNVALGYVKANAKKFGIDSKVFSEIDLHVHVPTGGVPKDGPSAGIALTTAILSAIKNVKIPSNVAMTGEITLRGRVLIIGGVKEKTISAYRGGADDIFLPKEDERYLDDVPKEVLNKIKITFVDTYDDVYNRLFK